MTGVLKQKTQKKTSAKKTNHSNGGPMGFPPYKAEKGEEYMSERQLEHFTKILHLWKDQLVKDTHDTISHMQDDSMNFPDILDRAAIEEEQKLEWQARQRDFNLIGKIDLALSKIQQGDYGYCDDCGTEIGIGRLEARPTATQCIDCKTIDEIREKQTGVLE